MCNVRTGPETKKNKKRMEGVLKRNGEKIFAQLELRFKMLLYPLGWFAKSSDTFCQGYRAIGYYVRSFWYYRNKNIIIQKGIL